MSDMTHTPGPWIANHPGDLVEVITAAEGDHRPVCHWTGFDDCFRSYEEHVANATLIAAAPDLFDVCEAVLAFWKDENAVPTYVQMARMAFLKAKGELE